MMQANSKLQDVLYIRCFAVISLVAWHSYCSYTCWGYGNSPLDSFYSLLFRILTPDANMPLFTFLAGYLFCFLLKEKNKYTSFKEFLLNKVHRLLIPFLILGTLTNLTEIDKSLVEMFYGKPSHLWYCLMLFYCYMACWLFEKWGGKKLNLLVAGVSCVIVLFKGTGALGPNIPFGLFLPLYYYCYFYIGFLVFNSKEQLLKLLRKYWTLILVLLIALAIGNKSKLILFQSLTYIALILVVFNSKLFVNTVEKNSRHKCYIILIVNSIAQGSMGIYVFHQWIIWNITRPEFLHNFIHIHYIVFPLLCWFVVFIVSWGLSYILITYTRWGKYLLT